jgi:hypothetical protein
MILGVSLCPEAMERARRDKGRGQDVVRDGVNAKVVWAVHSPLDPAASVSVPVVDTGRRTWRGSHAIKAVARRAAAP